MVFLEKNYGLKSRSTVVFIMSDHPYQTFPAGQRRGKKAIIRIAFFILGRSIQSASHFDKIIQTELNEWPDSFLLVYKVFPNGPELALCKKNNLLKRCKHTERDPDMLIYIKNVEYAFKLMTSQKGSVQAFIEHGAFLKGDVTIALSLIRILNRIQVYLYPRFLVKRLVKRVPKINMSSRYIGRLRLIFLGIPFGL